VNSRVEYIRRVFVDQGTACRKLGSPFMGVLLDLLADRLAPETAVGRAVFGWTGDPYPDALALRLTGALHGMVLDGTDPRLQAAYPPAETDPDALWIAVDAAMREHASRILEWLDRPPQTNVVARSGMLLPSLLLIARETAMPMRLLELGSSAGLNLICDRFHYDYGKADWGDRDSPVQLAPRVRGRAPDLDGDLVIAERAGCDLHPLDPREPKDRLRLMAYTWPDRTERLKQQATALMLAAKERANVVQADIADWVEAQLRDMSHGRCTVVMHSVVWQYLPEETKIRICRALEDAGTRATADAPIAWLRMEGIGGRGFAELRLTRWPGGETRFLAQCDWHGRWIEWQGSRADAKFARAS